MYDSDVLNFDHVIISSQKHNLTHRTSTPLCSRPPHGSLNRLFQLSTSAIPYTRSRRCSQLQNSASARRIGTNIELSPSVCGAPKKNWGNTWSKDESGENGPTSSSLLNMPTYWIMVSTYASATIQARKSSPCTPVTSGHMIYYFGKRYMYIHFLDRERLGEAVQLVV
ncbi:hypothetical protein M405DRAFT_192468 [Rhizopogon salebrosus TDB-379]|nr:hypothetical protein M405DRAFT_192468 [Rhizopogon salebrosus TDB-379]